MKKKVMLLGLVLILVLAASLVGCPPRPAPVEPEPAPVEPVPAPVVPAPVPAPVVPAPAPAPPLPAVLKIASGPVGGIWFPLAATLATIMEKEIGQRASPTVGGGVVNIRAIQAGTADIGWSHASSMGDAWHARPPFEFKHTNMRALASIYPTAFHIIVRKGLGIERVTDLRGMSVSPGVVGMTGEILASRLLAQYGMTYADFGRVSFMGYAAAALQMKDNHLDAYCLIATAPLGTFLDVAVFHPLDVISFSPEVVDRMLKRYEGLIEMTIPAGTYPGQGKDARTFGNPNIFIVRKDLPEEFVYRLTKALWENYEEFHKVHPGLAKYISPENALAGVAVPLHRGAYRFYVERGFVIPAGARPID